MKEKFNPNYVIHKITPSEIAHGNLFLSERDGMKKFFKQFDIPITIEASWETLYNRNVGKQYIWMGYEFMRNFRPYDQLKISNEKNTVRIELYQSED